MECWSRREGCGEMENYRECKQRIAKILGWCVLGQCTFCDMGNCFLRTEVISQGRDRGRWKADQVLGQVTHHRVCVHCVTCPLCS